MENEKGALIELTEEELDQVGGACLVSDALAAVGRSVDTMAGAIKDVLGEIGRVIS